LHDPSLTETFKPFEPLKTFSIYWEIRTLLYLGILFLTSGLGILVYKNIDTIGHQTILALIGLGSASCFWYSFKKSVPFTPQKVVSASSWLDYSLLLGVLLLGIFIGYLQFQYAIFGDHYGLAVGIPSLLYIAIAYRFDHLGVLQLGLSGLCAAVGIAVRPQSLINFKMLESSTILYSGYALGVFFALVAWISQKQNLKSHFEFSFLNFALHLCMITAFVRMILGGTLESALLFLVLVIQNLALVFYARKKQSYYLLLCASIYSYITLTYQYFHLQYKMRASYFYSGYGLYLYFSLSCGSIVVLLLKMKSFLGKENARLPKK